LLSKFEMWPQDPWQCQNQMDLAFGAHEARIFGI
jgi:hypothetical protein